MIFFTDAASAALNDTQTVTHFSEDIIMQTQINGKQLAFNEMGWLENRDAWDEDVAVEIAKSVNIELTEEHWKLINIAREYFEQYSTCCPPRAFSRILRQKYGKEHGNQTYIYKLFPAGGLVQCVNRIAGLPCPCDGSF